LRLGSGSPASLGQVLNVGGEGVLPMPSGHAYPLIQPAPVRKQNAFSRELDSLRDEKLTLVTDLNLAILAKEALVTEKGHLIFERDAAFTERVSALPAKDLALAERVAALAAKDSALS
jgi:hypothetical protein